MKGFLWIFKDDITEEKDCDEDSECVLSVPVIAVCHSKRCEKRAIVCRFTMIEQSVRDKSAWERPKGKGRCLTEMLDRTRSRARM